MSQQKYDPPTSPPPPAYGNNMNSPPPAHMANHPNSNYDASPYQNSAVPMQGEGYPPNMGQQGPNGYYPPGPQMGYGPQQGYQQQGPPQGGYYGQQPGPNQGYQQQYYGPPQGQFRDNRGSSGAGGGFLGACMGALACCCCLDLLF